MTSAFQRDLGSVFALSRWRVATENRPFAPSRLSARERSGLGNRRGPVATGNGGGHERRGKREIRESRREATRAGRSNRPLYGAKRGGVWRGSAVTRFRGVCGGTAAVRNPQCFLWSGCHGNSFEQISGQIGGHVGVPVTSGLAREPVPEEQAEKGCSALTRLHRAPG